MTSKQQATSRKIDGKKYSLALFAASMVLMTACTPKTAVAEGSKTFSAEHLAAGKTIFENSCARCHALPDPTAHSAQDWVGIMNWMAPKAKLTEEQHSLVYDYIVSVKK